MTHQLFMSGRGIPLVRTTVPTRRPILTVENYEKWYDLYVIDIDGAVCKLDSWQGGLDAWLKAVKDLKTTAWAEHCFHPTLVTDIAKSLEMDVCANSLDMITGRWVQVIEGREF